MRKSRCTAGINDNGGKFATCVNDSTANLPPVSTTPVATLPPVSITPMASFATGTAGVVDTGGPRRARIYPRRCSITVYFSLLPPHPLPPHHRVAGYVIWPAFWGKYTRLGFCLPTSQIMLNLGAILPILIYRLANSPIWLYCTYCRSYTTFFHRNWKMMELYFVELLLLDLFLLLKKSTNIFVHVGCFDLM
jgi:hypothetical protein